MRTAPPVHISKGQRKLLLAYVAGEEANSRLARRARIVLAAGDGNTCKAIGARLGVSQPTVRLWRNRFLSDGIEGLHDAPRPGRPPMITDIQVQAVIEATRNCKPFGEERWSRRSMAKAMGISRSSVHRIWKSHGLGPHSATPPEVDGLWVGEPTPTDKGYQLLTVELRRFGRGFAFGLCGRRLQIADDQHIAFYWMDLPSFHMAGGGSNFRPMLDLWWAAMEADGVAGEDRNLRNLVLASAYPVFAGSRGRNDVFRVAFLSRILIGGANYKKDESKPVSDLSLLRDYSLPPDEYARLQNIARRRDMDGVRREINAALVGEGPGDGGRPPFQKEFEEWLERGIKAYREGGKDGLDEWVRDVLGPLMTKQRKRGRPKDRQGNEPRFVHHWAVESAVGFHVCFTNALGCLVDEFCRGGLDPRSARFMRLWHNLNLDDTGRDVFWGHILSLHPVSGQVMRRPEHWAAVSRWLMSTSPDKYETTEEDYAGDEYSNLIAAIMAAAHEYRHIHEAGGPFKYGKARPRPSGDAADEGLPDKEVFNAYAYQHHLHCPSCGKLLTSEPDSKRTVKDDAVFATFVCGPCGHRVEEEVLEGPGARA